MLPLKLESQTKGDVVSGNRRPSLCLPQLALSVSVIHQVIALHKWDRKLKHEFCMAVVKVESKGRKHAAVENHINYSVEEEWLLLSQLLYLHVVPW